MPTARRSAFRAVPVPTAAALVATALAAALAAGCYRPAPSPPPVDPAEAQVADALLTEAVRSKLLEKLGTGALEIQVVARGDLVLLTGAVEERSTQELAYEVARSVPGVRKVDNKIGLVPRTGGPGTFGRAAAATERELGDADLESQVKSRLLGEIGRWALEIEVEAADGVVSLRGWVPDAAREKIALDTARGVRGVREVIDLIRSGLAE